MSTPDRSHGGGIENRVGELERKLLANVLTRANNLSDLDDAATARDNLGVAWAQIFDLRVTASASSIIIPIPSTVSLLRITAKFWASVANTYLMGRVSVDGGGTYQVAAANYNNTYGGNSASTMFASANANESYMRVSGVASTTVTSLASILMDPGSEGGIIEYRAEYGGQHSVNGSVWGFTQGYVRLVSGPATHLMLYPLSGTIEPKTHVVVEGVYQ